MSLRTVEQCPNVSSLFLHYSRTANVCIDASMTAPTTHDIPLSPQTTIPTATMPPSTSPQLRPPSLAQYPLLPFLLLQPLRGLAQRRLVQVAPSKLQAAHLLLLAPRLARAVLVATWLLELVKSFWVLLVLWVPCCELTKEHEGVVWMKSKGEASACLVPEILVFFY